MGLLSVSRWKTRMALSGASASFRGLWLTGEQLASVLLGLDSADFGRWFVLASDSSKAGDGSSVHVEALI